MTSRGRFGTEDEKALGGTSTRRRSVPRSLAAISVGGSESIMLQALRLEEQQRAKEEKRLIVCFSQLRQLQLPFRVFKHFL